MFLMTKPVACLDGKLVALSWVSAWQVLAESSLHRQ